MVQKFNVVRCYSCETFQVDQVKRSTNRWWCKVCHEKQSLKQIFFQGNGKYCRLKCQQFNMKIREDELESNQSYIDTTDSDIQKENLFAETSLAQEGSTPDEVNFTRKQNTTKWSAFVETGCGKSLTNEDNSKHEELHFRGEYEPKQKRKRNFNSQVITCSESEMSSSVKRDTSNKRTYGDLHPSISKLKQAVTIGRSGSLQWQQLKNTTPSASYSAQNNQKTVARGKFNHILQQPKHEEDCENKVVPVKKTSKWSSYVESDNEINT